MTCHHAKDSHTRLLKFVSKAMCFIVLMPVLFRTVNRNYFCTRVNCCQALRVIPVGFLLLRYSVLFTVEFFFFALSPFYILMYSVIGDDALIK